LLTIKRNKPLNAKSVFIRSSRRSFADRKPER
jgi:hypothetical protein